MLPRMFQYTDLPKILKNVGVHFSIVWDLFLPKGIYTTLTVNIHPKTRISHN